MISLQLWEIANGTLAILGSVIVVMVLLYLWRNRNHAYHEPIRFISIAFGLVILGHTIKDVAVYSVQCCGANAPDWLLVAALICVALGKLGCLKIWARSNWPMAVAVVLVAAFVAAHLIF